MTEHDTPLPAPHEGATPRPWYILEYGDGDQLVIHSDPDTRVCFMATPGSAPNSIERIEANAALIVAAVNAYDPEREGKAKALVEAAKRVEAYIDAIVCYASSCDEHEPNAIAVDLRAALKAMGE